MSIASPLTPPLFSIPPYPVRRFSVAEYQQMIEAGVLGDEDRVELLDGWITPKMTINPPHATVVSLVQHAVDPRLASQTWRSRVQCPIALSTSQPEPDLAIVTGPLLRYLAAHPGPAEVALVVEVADSTLASDRSIKGPLYADAGIAVYWIVNIPDGSIEVYTQPSAAGYAQRQDYQRGDAVPLVLGGQVVGQIPVVELVG